MPYINLCPIDTTAYMGTVGSVFASTATRAYIQTTNLAGVPIKSSIYLANILSGYFYVGYSVDARESFSLAAATKGNSDSLIIPVQDSAYSTRQYILKYPVTYDATYANNIAFSSWSFSGDLSDHFLLDLPSQWGAAPFETTAPTSSASSFMCSNSGVHP